MAVVADSIDEVRKYLSGMGADVDGMSNEELEEAIKFLETQYQIIDRSKVTNSKKEFNKMRLIHLELVKK